MHGSASGRRNAAAAQEFDFAFSSRLDYSLQITLLFRLDVLLCIVIVVDGLGNSCKHVLVIEEPARHRAHEGLCFPPADFLRALDFLRAHTKPYVVLAKLENPRTKETHTPGQRLPVALAVHSRAPAPHVR